MRCPANAAGAGQGALISDRDPASARILILCHGGGGGSTRAAVDLAAALDRRGRRVALATVGHPAWAAPVRHHVLPLPAGAPGRPDRPWPAGAIEAAAERLAALCRIERPDVLHIHYAQPLAAVAGQAATLLGQDAPGLVVTLHGSDLTAVLDDGLRRRTLVDDLASAAAVSTVSGAYAGWPAAFWDGCRRWCPTSCRVSVSPCRSIAGRAGWRRSSTSRASGR